MPHPIDIHVGKRLRARRTILGMSQEAIGTAIGVSFQQIQKYERGVNRMGASRLFDFAKILDTSVGYFFEDYQDAAPSGASGLGEPLAPAFEYEDPLASRETLEMMRAYYQITSKPVRKRLLDLIKTLASEQTR